MKLLARLLRTLVAITIALLGPPATAEKHRHEGAWICRQGEATRKVSIEYDADSTVPCRVKYQKPERLEYPWRAERETGYCEAKAIYLVKRLQGLGWACVASDNQD